MTAPNLEQTIADHLIVVFFPSRLDGGVAMEWYVKCHCEWAEYAPTHAEAEQKFAAHVVAAIRDSGGYTVIALPEPTSSDDTGTEWLDGEVFVGSPGNGRVRCYLEDHRLNDDDAADLGAALIAASLTAQGDKQ